MVSFQNIQVTPLPAPKPVVPPSPTTTREKAPSFNSDSRSNSMSQSTELDAESASQLLQNLKNEGSVNDRTRSDSSNQAVASTLPRTMSRENNTIANPISIKKTVSFEPKTMDEAVSTATNEPTHVTNPIAAVTRASSTSNPSPPKPDDKVNQLNPLLASSPAASPPKTVHFESVNPILAANNSPSTATKTIEAEDAENDGEKGAEEGNATTSAVPGSRRTNRSRIGHRARPPPPPSQPNP